MVGLGLGSSHLVENKFIGVILFCGRVKIWKFPHDVQHNENLVHMKDSTVEWDMAGKEVQEPLYYI